MTKTLTPKQQVFIAEYLVDLNAARAYRSAGYANKNADVCASQLLVNPKVAAAIAAKQGERLLKLEITADRVLNELALLAFANMLDYIAVGENGTARVDLSKLSREQAAAISEITVEEFTERTGEDDKGKPLFENVRRTKFKLTDKRGALVDLGRHLKLFTDKVQVDGELQVEVQDVKQKLLAKLHNRHTMDDVLAGRVEIPEHNAETCLHCKAGSLSQPSQISDNFR
jgi:phage terminase small subunit